MGDLVVTEFLTVDGVIEDPGGSEGFERGGWSFQFDRGADGDQYKLDETLASDALLLGRVTYEGFAAAWPSREGEFADKFNEMPKYVVSSTLTEPEWSNSTVIGTDLPAEVAALKERHDGPIVVHGSARLVRGLAADDLVDEYHLMVFPTVLGKGKRLFEDAGEPARLRLVNVTPVGPDGVVVLTYRPAGR
jgi:dihydrofolate reductase